MSKRIVPLVGTLAIGFAAGWFGHQRTTPPLPEEAVIAPPAPQLVPTERLRESSTPPPVTTPEELAAILETGSWKAVKPFAEFAKKDPATAYRILNSESPRVRRRFLRELYEPWILQDQEAALEAAAQEPKELHRFLYDHLGRVLAEHDPEEALEVGRHLTKGDARNTYLTVVLDAFFLKDPIDACRRLTEFPGARLFDPGRFYSESGMDPPDLSPEIMNAMVDALPPDRMEKILNEIFDQYWVNSEVEEAREWAFNLPAGTLRDQVTEEILWSDSYSDKHFEKLEEMNLTPEEHVRLMVNRSAYKAAHDPLAGLEAAREIQDPAAQQLAERSVYGTWINNDPAAAIAFISGESPSELRHFSSKIAEVLSESTPQQAIASALEIAAVSEDSTILTHVFENVAKEDISFAKAELEAIPPGDDRDAGIAGILESLSAGARGTRLDWALSISDPESRHKQLSTWASKDISGAQAWLEQASATLETEVHSEMAAIIDQASVNDQRRSRSVSSSFGTVTVFY